MDCFLTHEIKFIVKMGKTGFSNLYGSWFNLGSWLVKHPLRHAKLLSWLWKTSTEKGGNEVLNSFVGKGRSNRQIQAFTHNYSPEIWATAWSQIWMSIKKRPMPKGSFHWSDILINRVVSITCAQLCGTLDKDSFGLLTLSKGLVKSASVGRLSQNFCEI